MKRISKKGFTLLELIIAVVILAVLAVIAVPTFSSDISNSKVAVAKEDAAALARDAQADADSNAKSDGTISDPNLFVSDVAATDDANVTVVSTTNGWNVISSNGGEACVSIPATVNGAFTVTPNACA